MAAHLMANGEINWVVVGADRIAANGDTANKIGTYSVALAAQAHQIPFFVAAPMSTIDFSLAHGGLIPIEERDAREVTHIGEIQIAPHGINVRNPAFDVTPNHLISGIITDRGVAKPPFSESLKKLIDEKNS
jgi:methylthioribose-1-phosphate isomerase